MSKKAFDKIAEGLTEALAIARGANKRPRRTSGEETVAVDHNRTFTVVLKPEDKGGYTVRVPALPEIVTYGKNKREALAMAQDAIRLVMADCVARGELKLTDEQIAEVRRRRADPDRKLVSHAAARKRIKRLGA